MIGLFVALVYIRCNRSRQVITIQPVQNTSEENLKAQVVNEKASDNQENQELSFNDVMLGSFEDLAQEHSQSQTKGEELPLEGKPLPLDNAKSSIDSDISLELQDKTDPISQVEDIDISVNLNETNKSLEVHSMASESEQSIVAQKVLQWDHGNLPEASVLPSSTGLKTGLNSTQSTTQLRSALNLSYSNSQQNSSQPPGIDQLRVQLNVSAQNQPLTSDSKLELTMSKEIQNVSVEDIQIFNEDLLLENNLEQKQAKQMGTNILSLLSTPSESSVIKPPMVPINLEPKKVDKAKDSSIAPTLGGLDKQKGIEGNDLMSLNSRLQTFKSTLHQNDGLKSFGENLIMMLNKGISKALIQIDPPELGSMEVTLSLDKNKAQLSIMSQQALTKDLVESQIDKLRESFSEIGVDLGEVNVQHQQQDPQYSDSKDHQSLKVSNFAQNPENSDQGDVVVIKSPGSGLLDLYA